MNPAPPVTNTRFINPALESAPQRSEAIRV
jgi:hypothetical protein